MFRFPKEPSIIGIMTLNFLLGIGYGNINLIGLIAAVIAFLIHLLTFTYVRDNLIRRRYKELFYLITLNTYIYVVGFIIIGYSVLIPLLMGGLILTIYFISIYRLGYKSVPSLLIGTVLLTDTFLVGRGFMGNVSLSDLFIWGYISVYYLSSAYYVETRLAFRNVNPLKPLIIWLGSLLVFIPIFQYLLLSMIEPSLKFFLNAIRNKKHKDHKSIRILGYIESIRSIVFTLLIYINYILMKLF